MPLQIGDVLLDKYRLEALIGRGAFGEVYRVTHISLNVPRAIKILRRDAPGIGSFEFNDCRSRFQFEAQLGARLNTPAANPHLLQVHDFKEKGRLLLLEMEYASGGSLAERLEMLKARGENMPVGEAVQMGIEVAEGLSALHKLDIVHRDLKPKNILFGQDGHAKVADLGLAQMLGGPSQRTQLGQDAPPHPGTPAFMSPEQHNSRDYLPPASDVYTLGLVLFEALTGRIYRSLRPGTRASSLRPDVSVWLDDLLVRMLAEDPRERPWNGQEAGALLRDGLAEDAAKQPGALPLRRNKIRPAWIIALVGLAVVILFAFWGMPRLKAGLALTPTLIVKSTHMPTPTLAHTPTVTRTHTPTVTHTLEPSPTPTITLSPTATLGVGSTLVRPADGMAMVYVPAGEFTMGSPEGTGEIGEHPQHTVYLDAYWIDQTEVTNAMYGLCVKTSVCQPPYLSSSYTRISYYGNSEYTDYPVINVDSNRADSYCRWADGQLPTEAQWEKAARGTDGRTYPWGNDSPGCSLANFGGEKGWGCVGDTSKVGTYPSGASPYGVLDMAGNVWEWVADWYDSSYYAKSPASNPSGPSSGQYRVLRGGSWTFSGYVLRSAGRLRNTPDGGYTNVGFRCARSAP